MSASHDPERLIAYLLNEHNPEERIAVETHIKECPQCRTRLEELSLVSARLTADAAAPAGTGDEDTFLIELNNRIDERQARPGLGALRWLAAGGAFILILLMISQRPAPVAPRPRAHTSPAQPAAQTNLRLARHTPAVYPDFSGFSQIKTDLAGKTPSLSPGPMPAFPAPPQLTEGVPISFPKIKL